jgi:antitoxin (DNA-binding transcriptional repressor) of toxin-antitoxin stability system
MDQVKIIPVTDLRRNFGEITSVLATMNEIVLTKDGRPFAVLRAAVEEKRKLMKGFAGSLKGTVMDDDKLWEDVLKRKSRKVPIDL